MYGSFQALRCAPSARQQPRRRIESEDVARLWSIERKVAAGPDADIEHAAFGLASDAGAIGAKPFVAHRQIGERRQQPIRIKSHRRLRLEAAEQESSMAITRGAGPFTMREMARPS